MVRRIFEVYGITPNWDELEASNPAAGVRGQGSARQDAADSQSEANLGSGTASGSQRGEQQ